MIRFNCPSCGRHYELIDAMAHLRLLCKKCGHPIVAPEPGPDPEPEPEPEPPPPVRPPTPTSRPKTAAKPTPRPVVVLPPLVEDEPDEPVLLGESNSTPEVDSLPPGPVPVRAEGTPPPAPRGKFLPVLVDAAVGLILLAAGVILGETLVRKSTVQVLRDAGSAVRFPPEELLIWAAPPLLFGLVYLLLMSRGATVGSWLKRRAAG